MLVKCLPTVAVMLTREPGAIVPAIPALVAHALAVGVMILAAVLAHTLKIL
jgi:hypothetical protein